MRSSALLLASLSILAGSVASQAAAFTNYGTGCGPSGMGCISANWGNPFSGSIGASANFAILSNTGATTRVICGVELFCKTQSGSSAVTPVDLYDRDATTGQPGKSLGSTSMKIGGTAAAYTAMFSSPIIINANTDFFIVFNNVGLNLPIASSGTSGTHYWSGPPAWRGPFSTVRWMYNVLCCGSAIPSLTNNGLPKLGQTFSIDLSNAKASANAFFAVGLGKTNIDLSIAGAPNCFLLTNPLLLFGVTTDASGASSFKIPVPNDSKLLGLQFHSQYAVNDAAANNLGLSFTNGGEGTAGN